jgi:hypothetical protein
VFAVFELIPDENLAEVVNKGMGVGLPTFTEKDASRIREVISSLLGEDDYEPTSDHFEA